MSCKKTKRRCRTEQPRCHSSRSRDEWHPAGPGITFVFLILGLLGLIFWCGGCAGLLTILF